MSAGSRNRGILSWGPARWSRCPNWGAARSSPVHSQGSTSMVQRSSKSCWHRSTKQQAI